MVMKLSVDNSGNVYCGFLRKKLYTSFDVNAVGACLL